MLVHGRAGSRPDAPIHRQRQHPEQVAVETTEALETVLAYVAKRMAEDSALEADSKLMEALDVLSDMYARFKSYDALKGVKEFN